ncbi:hypothetical protein OAK75_12250, partial [Bacteriovoracales bacterium]|nr:hypothetical protein [Bacteriovoracales bacterium]
YVIDYNTKLAQAKDNYYKTARKMKTGYDKQLDENNKINKIKSDKQVKAHHNYVQDLNDSNERHLQETTSRANNLIRQREAETRKLLRKMRDGDRDERSDLKRGYTRKLNNISESYDKTLKDQKRHFNNTAARIKRNSKSNIERQKRQSLDELDRFTKSAENTLDQTKRNMKQDNINLQKSFQREKDDILSNASEKELLNRNNFNKRLQEIKDIYKNELKYINDKNAANLETARKKDTSALDNLNVTFNERLNSLTDKFEYELGDIRHRNDLEKQKMTRVHKSEIQAKSQEANDKIKIIGGKDKHDQETRKLVEKYEHRLDKMTKQMRDEGIKRMRHLEQGEADLKDDIMDQNLEHKEYIANLNEEFDGVTRDKVERSRKEQTKIKDSFRRKIRTIETDHEREMIQTNRLSSKKLENQNKILNSALEDFSEKNIKNAEKMQSDFNKERNDIKEHSEKKLSEDVAHTRKLLEGKLEKTIESYEHRINIKNNNINEQQEKYERKIEYLEEVIRNKEKEYETFETQTRADDRQEMAVRLKDQRKDFEVDNKRMRHKFDTYMKDVERKNKRSMDKLVRKYEKELSDRQIEFQKTLKDVKGKNKSSFDKANKDANNERESIIQSYEDKLKNMKDIYNENIEMFRELRSKQTIDSID